MSTTLQKAIDLFLGEHIPSTRRSYYYVFKKFAGWIGPNRPIASLTSIQILEFGQALRDDPAIKSPHSYNKYVKDIRALFNWAIKAGLIEPPSPAKALKLARQKQAIPREKAMPEPAFERLLDYAKWRPRSYALVLFLGDTGCRIGGCAGLRWSDVDLENHTAHVTEKGDKTRPVFFGETCALALAAWKTGQPLKGQGDYVFSMKGERINNDSLGMHFERICKLAGIGAWGPHSLRHRKGHQFADNKVPVSVASQALGHDRVLTTLEYYYPQDWDRVREALNQLAHKASDDGLKIINFKRKVDGG